MITPEEIEKKALRQYERFLKSAIASDTLFPMSFPVGPIPKNYPDLLKSVTRLIESSKAHTGTGYCVELETINTRKFGPQSAPSQIYLETEADYLALLKKEEAFSQFQRDVALIQATIPALTEWLSHYPLKVIEHAGEWDDLLKVCGYFQQHSQPNLYIRELPIAVHTKFIEEHKKILRSLLEAMLPEDALTAVEGKKHVFEQRFGLRYEEPLIRFRILDPALQARCGFPTADMSLPVSDFGRLDFGRLQLGEPRCFITENKMPFLTLPFLENGIAIFGGGYANQLLKVADWLAACPIFYWGDMDSYGFEILAQLRSHFPQTQSILMDSATYEHFRSFSVSVATQSAHALPNLTEAERVLYTYLTTEGRRLEQERISQTYSNQRLQGLAASGG